MNPQHQPQAQSQTARGAPPALLPPSRIWRPRGPGWLFSMVAHGLLFALAVWGLDHAPEEPPPTIRLVFVEPPPPPPAPLGAPAATGTTPTPKPPAVVEKPKKVKKPKEPVKPKRTEPDRLKVAKKPKKQKPPEPEPEPILPVELSAISTDEQETDRLPTPQAGLTTGAVAGVAGGVVGGVTGGVTGGVIGGQGTGPLPADQVANPPILLTRVMPEYPRRARRQGIEGLVLLEAVLDREGRIEEDIKVLQSIPSLDEAAIEALRRWRFRPARDDHKRPVRVILEVLIRFVLR